MPALTVAAYFEGFSAAEDMLVLQVCTLQNRAWVPMASRFCCAGHVARGLVPNLFLHEQMVQALQVR